MDDDDAAEEVGERLDKVVAERFGLSRRLAREAIQLGRVDLGGEPCLDPARPVEPGAEVAHHPNRPRPGTVERRLAILHEDDDVLIVDKPAGLLVQPSRDREPDTLLERAGRYLARKRGSRRPRVETIDRIGRRTSGVVLVAISPRGVRPLQSMFRERSTDRTFLAVVEGVFLTPEGTIDLPLADDDNEEDRGGGPAITRYQVVETYGRVASLVQLRLGTGRSRQARVHMAGIGHPIVGDSLAGRTGRPRFPIRFPRHALHSATLSFIHPLSKRPIRVEAPWPADFAGLVDELKRKHGVERIDDPAPGEGRPSSSSSL